MRLKMKLGIVFWGAFLAFQGAHGEITRKEAIANISNSTAFLCVNIPTGKIIDFRLTSNPLMTIKERKLKNAEEIIPGTGIKVTATAYYGSTDGLWPNGLNIFKVFHLKELNSKSNSLCLTAKTGFWTIEKTIKLEEESSSLDFNVKISSRSSEEQLKSYWFQIFLCLADSLSSMPGDDSEMLLLPSRKETVLLQGVNTNVKMDGIFYRNPESRKNYSVAPGAPYLAAIDKTHKLLFAIYIPDPQFPADALYYSWCGYHTEFYSAEVIFPSFHFGDGKTKEYSFKIMLLQGLGNLNYMTQEWALELINPPEVIDKAQNKVELNFALASPRRNSLAEFELQLSDSSGNSNSVQIKSTGLQPDRIVAAKAVFELNNLSPGVLNLLIKPKDKGKDQLIGKFQLK